MTSKTDSVDYATTSVLFGNLLKYDANRYSTVLFNVYNVSYVIPQFEYRKNKILFWC